MTCCVPWPGTQDVDYVDRTPITSRGSAGALSRRPPVARAADSHTVSDVGGFHAALASPRQGHGGPARTPLTTSEVLGLQRLAGNRATAKLVGHALLQREKREMICVPGSPADSPQCLDARRQEAEVDAARKRKSRSDLTPAADAFHGVAPYYMVRDQLPRNITIDSDYSFKFSDWLIIPHFHIDKERTRQDQPLGPVVYWIAWNPEDKRAELVIGPDTLGSFLSHEHEAKELRNLSYFAVPGADEWGDGQPSADEVYIAKAFFALGQEHDVAKALKLWGKAWLVQAENPMTWMNVIIAYAGTAGKPGPSAGAQAPEPRAPTTTPHPQVEAVEHSTAPSATERPAVTGPAVPKPSLPAAEPRVLLPNGKSIPPDSYSGGYYGTATERPQVVKKEGFRQRGSDWRLREHSEGNPNSALRGTTNLVSDGAGNGAAYWAGEGGYVYEIRRVATWDVNKNLQGQVPSGGGFRGNLMHGEAEYAIPGEVPPNKVVRWGIVKDKGGDRLYVEWHEWHE